MFLASWWLTPSAAVAAPEPAPKPVLSNGEVIRGAEAVDFVEITPDSRKAVEKGLAYLASRQQPDGSFGAERNGQNVGIVSLACIAFMADGNLPGRGKYGANVEKGLGFILRNAQENGLIAADMAQGPMYGHGFATLFLGEIYGMTRDERVREALVKAVRLIATTQNAEGGWRYHPVPFDADLSVTICQIMGLRSARNAGVSVPKETIDKAISYVRTAQNPDGGFKYMLNSGGSAFPRSAAGVASLYYAGIYNDNALQRGLDYLVARKRESLAGGGGHFHYGQYYAVQAMYLAGGKYWADWYPEVRDQLVKQQQPDGSWSSEHGNDYGSAMSLIILQVPNRFLPIFQR